MKKTIEDRMITAEGRIAAAKGISALIQQAREYDFYTADEGDTLLEWEVRANAVTQAKIEAYCDIINTLLD